MANIVDALIATLGLDTKDYEKGIDRAEKDLDAFDKKRIDSEKKDKAAKDKAHKEEERREKEKKKANKENYESLAKIRNQLIGIATLFTAGQGLIAFAKNSITTAANVGRLSENTDMAVSSIAGLGQAFERTGGSAEEAQATITMLTKNIANMKMGMESNVAEFMRWGGDINHGQLKDTKAYMLGIADLLQRINKTSPSKAWMIAGRMGLSDTAFNLLKQGRKAVEAQIADGARMTGMNKRQADEARMAQRTWADMASTLASIGRAVLFPILKEIGSWMQAHQKDINGWLVSLRQFIANITPEAIGKVAEQFRDVADAIKTIAESLKQLRPLMDKLGLTTPDKEKTPGMLRKSAGWAWKNIDLASSTKLMQRGAKWAMKQGEKVGNAVTGDTNVTIGQMTITTQATDARGVAAGMHDALKNQGLVRQAAAQ